MTPGATSTTPRLKRGQIPDSWMIPAETVSIVPSPRRVNRIAPVMLIVGAATVVVVLALALRAALPSKSPASSASPASDASAASPTSTTPSVPTTSPSATTAANATTSTSAASDADRAAQTAATSATTSPTPIARVTKAQAITDVPEPPPTASSAPTGEAPEDQGGAERPAASTDPAAAGIVGELPARKKARDLVARGEKLLLAKDAAGAEPFLRRAAALDPTFAPAWRALGIARASLGNTSGARIAYKKYLTLAPDAPDAKDVRAILDAR